MPKQSQSPYSAGVGLVIRQQNKVPKVPNYYKGEVILVPTGNKSPPKAKAVMYVQQIAHLPVQTFDMLIEYVEQRIRPKCWAAIVHDQDVDEEGKPV